MRYPAFLKDRDTLGYVAPSFGVSGYPYAEQFQEAKRKFLEMGYAIKEAESLYDLDPKLVASNTPEIRARELMEMMLDKEVDFVHSVAGGELMVQILPHLDFEALKEADPKWYMGYSDNTNFTFLYTLLCDTASIYGGCVENFGMKDWHASLQEAYEIMRGKRLSQKSYEMFAVNDISHEENMALASYDLTEKTEIKVLNGRDITVKGRLLGGCLDCLNPLIGTPYDKVAEFSARYEKDGILFYLEACDLNPVSVIRSLVQMKEAGWFDKTNAILFGREHNREPFFAMTFEDALHQVFDDADIPVIYGLDFGHVPPVWTLINGAVATLEVKDQKASITYELL